VKPGDTVTAGQLLAELDTQALKLQRIDEQAKLIQATSERDAALSKGNQAEADQAEARMIQSQARIDLLNMQIEQGMIRSPMDAIVLAGDWHDQINSMVKQGDAMFEIAPLDRMTVVMRVDESDINRISRAFELATNESAALTGEMATAAEPNRALPLHVTRIVPMAYAEEGQNIFEVWCEMDGTEPWLRPGMEGTARIDMGRKPIAWILSHRIIDSVRLWLWK
ncbi:MAG: HlyD family efflux transporter periplasmic adaptor subunit, partial [Desulfobacterales bacterium]|nr:HlyD family efflux transporter periplasmic adaptor subunit [Desulfobacterales bacterium]